MTNSDLPLPNDNPEWKVLAEFLIPRVSGMENQVLEHFQETVKQFELDPQQIDRIMLAIDESLRNLEESLVPIHLRISVSGLESNEMPLEEDIENHQEFDRVGSSLGFFVVKRVVSQFHDQVPSRHRLVEVLIYRELSQ